MHNIKLLSIEDDAEWNWYLNKLGSNISDIYYSPEYYKIYEGNGDGTAKCFIYERNSDIVLYPFLLNGINKLGYELDNQYYDIQGAYGYNGVLTNLKNKNIMKYFYKEFTEYCIANKIVAEFTRFNPLINNHILSNGYMNLNYNRRVVYIDLRNEYEIIYKNYTHTLKSNLKKALKNNVKVVRYKNKYPFIEDFIRMYAENMKRINAQKYFYFSNEYFYNTFQTLPVTQFVAFLGNLPIASAICLSNGLTVHVHFAASYNYYLHLRPNEILIDSIIKWGLENSFRTVLFGGGTTNSEDDSLLRFKKKFSKDVADFYIGWNIYNQAIYDLINLQWHKKYPQANDKYKNHILKYRFRM